LSVVVRPLLDVSDHDDSDDRLVDRVGQGDPQALELIFRRHGRLLLDVVHGYLAAPDEAEEVVQDLFLWIWEHRTSWSVPTELRPYLLTAARNRALNRLRHRQVERRVVERLLGAPEAAVRARAPGPDPLESLTGNELSRVIAAAVADLPPRCRDVFLMLRRDELSHREVAATLGISPKTVEIHMTRALTAIRAAVARWRGGG
jgi:RNA polymerase sigma-70 factor (ECF subfamily)